MSDSANRRPAGPPGSATRRQTRVLVIVGLVAVAVVASALVGWRFARESTPVSGPILLISIDPLPPGRLQAYGGTSGATPHLDRLAASATVFTDAYGHAAATLPAHASLFTGQLPYDHGVRDDVGFTLAAGTETLASRLADRGFATGAAVSSYRLRAGTGLDAGFGRYDDERPAAETAAPPPVERDSAATATAAEAWLDEQDSARFFYTLHLNGTAGADGIGPSARASADAGIAAADAAVGRVLETLRRKGWYDDALVVVTSTSGAPPDADGSKRAFALDPQALHVPLLVKMPGAAAPQQVDVPLQHVDVAPTVLDLVRAPGASSLSGRSVRGLLEGDGEGPPPVPRYAEAMSGALRFGWRELSEPGANDGATSPASVAKTTPAIASDEEREALARLGDVAPTLRPLTAAPAEERPDPATMGPVLAAYALAARHDADRELAAAITAYRRVVDLLPTDANAWYRIGLAAGRLGRTDQALAAFDRVEALRPGSGDGALAAAQVEAESGLADRAAQRVAATLAALPATAPPRTVGAAHAALATIAASRRRADDARREAALAEEADPDLPYAAFIEGRMLHDRDEGEAALDALDRVASALGDRPSPFDGLHWYRGDTLARLDRHAEAQAAFERAIRDAPFDLRGYVSLATLQRAMNRDDDALVTVDQLVRRVPTPAGYAAAVRLSTLLGQRERAAELRAEARQRLAGEPALRLVPR